jgi:hypothetical protein
MKAVTILANDKKGVKSFEIAPATGRNVLEAVT